MWYNKQWSNSSAWSGSGEESSSPKRCELCALFSCFFRI